MESSSPGIFNDVSAAQAVASRVVCADAAEAKGAEQNASSTIVARVRTRIRTSWSAKPPGRF
jgi:hypothetical protein